MKALKQLFSLQAIWYLAFAAFFSYVVPIIFAVAGTNDVLRIEFILFLIDVAYAVLVGIIIGKKDQTIIFTIFFPLLFQISYSSFFGGFSSYVRYFGPVYLLMTLLAYGASKD